jgi:peptidoglycan glycosyltransferase
LLLTGAFLLVNFLALAILRDAGGMHWWHLAVWGACAATGHLLLSRGLPERDVLLFPLVMLLSGWGLLLIDRLTPRFADRQTLWLVVSTGALLASALLPYLLRWLRQYRYLLLIVGLSLLMGTILLGRNPSGLAGAPELWLGVGNVFFQPSEALKVILVAFLASYLSEQFPALRAPNRLSAIENGRAWLSPRILGPVLMMWGLCMVVLVWQRDLGTAALFFMVFLLLLYVASGQTFILAGGLILILIAGAVAYQMFTVVELRVDIWLNPWPEADSRAYQIVQSLMAFGAGGIGGAGIGQGSPGYIPVAHSDFIFAALAEEHGLLGVLSVIVALVTLVVRGLRVAIWQQERPFYALMATGLSLLIAIQSLLIMGGVLKIVPLTGVTLPYMSYGGSSMLVSFIIAGLLLRLSAGER